MSIFTILRQPVAISDSVSLILIKVTNDRFILYFYQLLGACAPKTGQKTFTSELHDFFSPFCIVFGRKKKNEIKEDVLAFGSRLFKAG